MKKILALVLVGLMIVSLCSCGKKEEETNNTASDTVNQNTISLVNASFDTTGETLSDAEALGVKVNFRRNSVIGEESQSMYLGLRYDRIGTGEGKKFLYEHEVKSGDTSDSVIMYSDGKNIYGYKADTSYLLVNDNITNDYINEIEKDIEVFDSSDFEVLDTVIIDTSSGGHAFVIKYKPDDSDFDPKEVFGPLFAEGEAEVEIKPVSLSVSGIIDTEGRLLEQAVTFEYTYEYEDMSNVDPENVDAKGEMKTVAVKLVTEAKFNHDLTSISAPDGLTLLPEDEESEGEDEDKPEIKELSLSDFLKLGQQSGENTGNTDNKTDKNNKTDNKKK